MSSSIKKLSPTDLLVAQFQERAKGFQASVELIKVLKSRTYQIGESNVLVRAAIEGNRRFFFGINYLTIEEISNLDNPFIAFICGSVDNMLMLPAQILFDNLSRISHDRNGEYKITIDTNLSIALSGRGNRLDCSKYINDWDLLLSPPKFSREQPKTVEESLHSVLQGRLLEIGNIRGYQTFCPDKSRKFNERKLEEIATLQTCPKLEFSDHKLLRLIDVLWFKARGSNLIPECAFEIELSTGVWSGVGRMSTLLDYKNVSCYVVANDSKKFTQVMNSFSDYESRFKFIGQDSVGELYSAEKDLRKLISDLGLPHR